MTDTGEVEQVAGEALRASYGRLLAYLASDTRDVAAAEDALADAFERAVRTWPERGIPAAPEAWLLTTARRRLIDGHRRRLVAERAEPALRQRAAELDSRPVDAFPDKRLELMFVCAHPAIDHKLRAPLMLQTVLGVDAARIASAFLVAPAAMGQRLVRAKRKIRDAGIAFRIPDAGELPERMGAVLDAIYAAFGTGWESDGDTSGLADEGVRLARIVATLLPDEVEAQGLLALVLYSHARRDARRADDGSFVALAEQDTSRWDRDLIAEADTVLARAASLGHVGPFMLEASIQATHARRAVTGQTDWSTIVGFYDALVAVSPTVGAQVAAAAAILEARGPSDALARLDAIDHPAIETYQPWWAVRAHALSRLDDAAAGEAIDRAAGLSEDPAIRNHLLALRRPSPRVLGSGMADTNHRITLAQRPVGEVDAACFASDDAPIPTPGPGEMLVEVSWLSIDPTIRGWMAMDTYLPAIEIGAEIRSGGLGTVIESNNDDFPVGSVVFGMTGWQQYTVMDSSAQIIPDGIEPEAALSVFGVTGLTAYFGLLDVGRPEAGETVLVSGAAGATGSVVGQIAKIKGCRVVGIAGSAEKCAWLVDELGYDAAINYRTDDVAAAIRETCPKGVDVFFDNVGGDILEAALGNLALRGRVVMCGAIAQYNDEEPRPGPKTLLNLISMRGRMEGFIILDYMPRAAEAIMELATWVMGGQLSYKVDVVEGLDNAPEALNRLFSGANQGKVMVKL